MVNLIEKFKLVLWQSGLCSGLLIRIRWVRLPRAPPFYIQHSPSSYGIPFGAELSGVRVPHAGPLYSRDKPRDANCAHNAAERYGGFDFLLCYHFIKKYSYYNKSEFIRFLTWTIFIYICII